MSAEFIAVSYSDEYAPAVRLGDTLRLLARYPDENTWSGNVAIKTSLGASAADDVAFAAYSGNEVQNKRWDLFNDYDTSSLVANTTYLAIAELTRGSIKVERVAKFTVLPQGRS